jgi:5,10-methylenetetrahydromethanopterin reductase
MRVGVGFTGGPFSVREVADLVLAAERKGIHSAWFAEDSFLRDALTPMSVCAALTKTIRLAAGVINPYSRNPVTIAGSLATIDELCCGRAILGLGTGVRFLVEKTGVRWEKPLQLIRETVQLIRELMKGEETNFQGNFHRVSGVTLGNVGEVTSESIAWPGRFRPHRSRVPIYIAAIGPKMLQLAGEIGDGVLLTAGCSPNYVRELAVQNVRIGAERAQRRLGEVDIAAYILTCMDGTPSEEKSVRASIAVEMSEAGPSYLTGSGVDEALAARIGLELQKNNLSAAIQMVDREVICKFAAFGDKSECVESIIEYTRAGVKMPVILPVAKTRKKALRTINVLASELAG